MVFSKFKILTKTIFKLYNLFQIFKDYGRFPRVENWLINFSFSSDRQKFEVLEEKLGK
jgi:hypothetical protein